MGRYVTPQVIAVALIGAAAINGYKHVRTASGALSLRRERPRTHRVCHVLMCDVAAAVGTWNLVAE